MDADFCFDNQLLLNVVPSLYLSLTANRNRTKADHSKDEFALWKSMPLMEDICIPISTFLTPIINATISVETSGGKIFYQKDLKRLPPILRNSETSHNKA